jgi:hypothetical protein
MATIIAQSFEYFGVEGYTRLHNKTFDWTAAMQYEFQEYFIGGR